MACPFSTTQSRTSKLSPQSIALLGAFVLTTLLWSCGAKNDKEGLTKPSPRDFAKELVQLSIRLETCEKWRGATVEDPFYQKTSVEKHLKALQHRVNGDRNDIILLAKYHQQAVEQGLSNEDQIKHKGATLQGVEKRIEQLESAMKTFETWQKRDGVDFDRVWSNQIQINRISGRFVKLGIKDVEGQARMRDHSSRLRDARRYWTDELTNAMRGAQVDGKMVDLARGTRRAIESAMEEITKKYRAADADQNSLIQCAHSIQGRINWAEETLKRAPKDDPWRLEAEEKLSAFKKAWNKHAADSEKAALSVLDRSTEMRQNRKQVLAEGVTLVNQINDAFIPTARKRGWPIPRVKRK